MPPMFLKRPPFTRQKQKPYRDLDLRAKEAKKILKARTHNYLLEGFKIMALINVFSVTKGLFDIHMWSTTAP
jgi:hypothetical protein